MPSGNATATASSRAREAARDARRDQENERSERGVMIMGFLMIGLGKCLLLPPWAA